jgi:threonine dehydratase
MLVQTMRFFVERMKMVVEPTGCLGAAAVMAQPVMGQAIHRPGERVGILLSGGNVDLKRLAELIG